MQCFFKKEKQKPWTSIRMKNRVNMNMALDSFIIVIVIIIVIIIIYYHYCCYLFSFKVHDLLFFN